MATLRRLHPFALISYAVLGVADLGLTLYLLRASGGRVYESNPLAGAWLQAYGSVGLAIFKALAMVLFAACAGLISLRHPQVGRRLLTAGCAITGGVVVYSAILVGMVGKHDHPRGYYVEERAAAIVQDGTEEEEQPVGTPVFGVSNGGMSH